MKKCFWFILLTIIANELVLAQPFQFIKYESATLVKKNKFEIKLNGIHETGQIYTNAGLLQLRYSPFKNFEVSANTIYANFIETNEKRFASVSVNAKVRLKFLDFNGYKFTNYFKFRMALGEKYIERYTGNSSEVLSMVSPYADEGKDLIIGFLARKSLIKNFEITFGGEYMRAEGRDYFNFTKDQRNVASVLVTPQLHVFKKKLLLLLVENKFTYWINRGVSFETIPEIRWEIIPQWVCELGVNLPLYGGKNYQYTFGFTYEF